jgi:hypothetical protein
MQSDLIEITNRVLAAYAPENRMLLEKRVVERANIEPIDAEFLCTVGFPRDEDFPVEFSLVDTLPSLREHLAGKESYYSGWPTDLRCLSDMYGHIVGVDNDRKGLVINMDLNGPMPTVLVNTRIRHMVGFMAETILIPIRVRDGSLSKVESLAMAKEWMRSVDEPGFNGGWWSQVLESLTLDWVEVE